jgi:glycosyltransferase involved in cell wall biosynthesis
MIWQRRERNDQRGWFRIKLAVLMPTLTGGGAELIGRRWAEELSARGHAVTILLTHPSPCEPSVEGCEIRNLGNEGAQQPLQLVRAIATELRRSRFEAVISVMTYWNLLLLVGRLLSPRRRATRFLISEHTLSTLVAMERPRLSAFRIQVAMARRLYRTADACLAVSHAVATEFRVAHRIPAGRVIVVPNAATVTAHPASRRSPGVESISIIVPGRFVAAKRTTLAFLVAEELSTRLPCRLVIWGSGPLEGELRAAATGASFPVAFPAPDARWFENCPADSVLLLPSAVEGFGNVLVEAACAGIPSVVASRALGVAEAVLPGITGYVVPKDTIHDYAEAVYSAAQLPEFQVAGWLDRFRASSSVEILELAIGGGRVRKN